jgi:aquaporin Z
MKYAAELFGTFVLVFVGIGTAVIHGGEVGHLGIALAFGLTLVAMIYTIGPISGCHINPAVTFGMFLSRRIGGRQAGGYMLAQVVGGILGAALVYLIASGGPGGFSPAANGFAATGYGLHSPGHYNLMAAFVAETFLTMLLVITVLGSTDVKAPVGFAGIAIGLMLTVMILAGIPVTNGSFNPARSIGPAVFVGDWALSQLWVFIVAPLLGAAIATGIYMSIRESVTTMTTKQAEQALPSEQAERKQQQR